MPKEREMEEKYAKIQESMKIWRFLGILLICLFISLIMIAIKTGDRGVNLVEVLEISKFNLPENLFAVGIRFRELETDKESQKAFLVESEENRIIKKGGRYALVYEGCSDEKLRQVGIEYRLLKVYELK